MDIKFLKKIIDQVDCSNSKDKNAHQDKKINSDGTECHNFKYENRLLDKRVTDLFAKELIEMLNRTSESDEYEQHLILKNIRKSCNIKPIDHLYFDDNMTEILKNAYEELPTNNSSVDKDLDSFVIRYLKEINVDPTHSSSFKPDVIQALLNLNTDKKKINDILSKDIIYWNIVDKDNGYSDILDKLWNVEFIKSLSNQLDDVSIKIKAQIENIILRTVSNKIEIVYLDDDDIWFYDNKELMKLIEICCISRECFQICCSIMNTIFIKRKFDKDMSQFIDLFIKSIYRKVENISKLYSTDLQYIVVLLDINLWDFNKEEKEMYISFTLKHLSNLCKECESDLIMLLSHFNQWFNIYYESVNNNMT